MQREKVAEQRQPAQEHERLKAMKDEASNIFKDDDSEDEEIFEQVATFAAELKSENKRSSNVVMMDKFCVVLFVMQTHDSLWSSCTEFRCHQIYIPSRHGGAISKL